MLLNVRSPNRGNQPPPGLELAQHRLGNEFNREPDDDCIEPAVGVRPTVVRIRDPCLDIGVAKLAQAVGDRKSRVLVQFEAENLVNDGTCKRSMIAATDA